MRFVYRLPALKEERPHEFVTCPKPTTRLPSKIDGPKYWVEQRAVSRQPLALEAGSSRSPSSPCCCRRPTSPAGCTWGTCSNHTEMDILAPAGGACCARPGAMAAGHRSRRHRHPAHGGASAGRASTRPTRQQLGREAFIERVWQWKESLRRRHHSTRCGGSAPASTGRANTSPWMHRARLRGEAKRL